VTGPRDPVQRNDEPVFGGRIVERSHRCGDSKVEYLDDTIVTDHDVLGFEVAMHDTRVVSGGQSPRRLGQYPEDFVCRTRLCQPTAQRVPWGELHGDEHFAVVAPDLEHRRHVGVRDASHCLGFAPQP